MAPVSPYNTFKQWLCDGDMKSELDPDIAKAIYIVSALAMFTNISSDVSIYLNDLYNKYNLYDKNLQPYKMSFFKELKQIATKKRLTPWSLSYVNMKKEKYEYKDLQDKFPLLKKYEIDLLMKISEKEKNKALIDMLTNKKPTKKKNTIAEKKLFK